MSSHSKSKKVIFLINSLNGGGAEKVLVNLANGLVNKGFDITISTLIGGVNKKSLESAVKVRTLIPFGNKAISGLLTRLFCKTIPMRLASHMLLRGKYDIEVAYLEGYPTRIVAGHDTDAAKVAFVHSDFSQGYTLGKVYSSFESCLEEYRSFDKVAFVSRTAMEGFENTIGKIPGCIVTYNVMDADDIILKSTLPCDSKYNDGKIKLITIGRLTKEKAFDRLIRAIHKLNEDKTPTELFILGTGELEQNLKALANNLNCSNIKFLGFRTNPYNYLAQADIMVCSSLYEGYSTTTVESMILGTPVVTTDCSGMDEILDGGKCGLIVNNSEEALYQGLKKVITSPELLKDFKTQAKARGTFFMSDTNLQQNINLLNSL